MGSTGGNFEVADHGKRQCECEDAGSKRRLLAVNLDCILCTK